jgi:hypothetical protein
MDMYVDEPEGVSLFNTVSKGYFACKDGVNKVTCDSSLDHKTPSTKLQVSRAYGGYYSLDFFLGCENHWWWIRKHCYKGRFSAQASVTTHWETQKRWPK